MRAGGLFLLAGLLGVMSLSSCVSGHRRWSGDGPRLGMSQAIPYRPEALHVGPTSLAYAPRSTRAPSRTIEVSPAPPPQPVTTPQRHVVAPGETLFAIARTRLGDESRWRDILAANPSLEGTALKAGQTITLPR